MNEGSMSAAPSFSTKTKLRLPRIGLLLGAIAAIASLIANIGTIESLFLPTLDGHWEITETIQQSSVDRFKGLQLTFDIYIKQRGDSFIADGEKTRENGRSIPLSARTQIHLDGKVEFSKARATFLLTKPSKLGVSDVARPTTGRFDWNLRTHGLLPRRGYQMVGTFSGTAAESSGTSTARQLLK